MRVNVRGSYLGGENSDLLADDFFAMQIASQDYTKQQIELGNWSAAKGDIKTYLQPSIVKMGYSKEVVRDLDNNELMGIAAIKQQNRIRQMAVDNATNAVFGDMAGQAIELPSSICCLV